MLIRHDGRLSQRGRLLRTFALLAAVAVGVVLGPQAFAEGDDAPPPTDTYTVMPGQTLWSIAGEIAPGEDASSVVAQIRELNGMDTAAVGAGDQILVPVYAG